KSVDLLRKQQKAATIQGSTACTRHHPFRLTCREQQRIGIDWSTSNNETGDRIERIMLNDTEDAPWLEHTQRFSSHPAAPIRRNVVVNTDGRYKIESFISERQLFRLRLMPDLQISTRLQHSL